MTESVNHERVFLILVYMRTAEVQQVIF